MIYSSHILIKYHISDHIRTVGLNGTNVKKKSCKKNRIKKHTHTRQQQKHRKREKCTENFRPVYALLKSIHVNSLLWFLSTCVPTKSLRPFFFYLPWKLWNWTLVHDNDRTHLNARRSSLRLFDEIEGKFNWNIIFAQKFRFMWSIPTKNL